MIIHDKNSYFQILEKFEIVPYTQSRGWCEMQSLYKPERVKYFVNDMDNPTIACFAHEKKMLGVRMIVIEEEAFKDELAHTPAEIKKFYEIINASGYKIIEVSSNSKYDFDYEIALRQAGFLRPVGLFSLPSTKIIDLTNPIGYNRDWKNNLKKAAKNGLEFEPVERVEKFHSEEFIKIYSEMSRSKSIGIPFNAELIEKLCSTGEFKLFFVLRNGVRIATTIIFQRNESALSLYAASGSIARSTSASYFMYDELFKYLADSGVKTFDMGKLLPSKEPVNNVFLFKNGIEGKHIQLNGEWARYSNPFYRFSMYFVKRYILKRKEI